MSSPIPQEMTEPVPVSERAVLLPPAAPVPSDGEGCSDRKLRILGALLEILLCSGVLTGIGAILLLRLAGVPDHLVLTQPLYLAGLGSLEALLLLTLIGVFLKRRGQSWQHLAGSFGGWTRETLLGFLLVPFLLGSNLLLGFIFENYLPQWHSESNPMLSLIQTPRDLAIFFFVALFVGGFKEEVQRAFLLQRFRDDLGTPYLGLGLWSLAFGYGHAIQGKDSATGAALFGLFFGFTYLRRKNLMAPVIAHSLYNSFILIGYWYWDWG